MALSVRRFLLLWLMSAMVPAVAEQGDFPPLENVPGARVMVSEYQPESYYTLALSTYRKVGGTWSAERERSIRGDVSRRTLEMPSRVSAREAYEHYREQLARYRLRELYTCRERGCGGSINWANNHFEVFQLYGLDEHQYYGVYELTEGKEVYYASLYAVRRGNQRVYVQLDLVHPKTRPTVAVDPATFGETLRRSGFMRLPGLDVTGTSEEWSLEVSEEPLKALVAMLRQESGWRIALVGHDYGPGSLSAQRERSRQYARRVRERLTEQGIDGERLEAFGLGRLAPAGRGERSARVEVVLLDDRAGKN